MELDQDDLLQAQLSQMPPFIEETIIIGLKVYLIWGEK